MPNVDLVGRKATVKLETPEPKEREFPVDLDVNEYITMAQISYIMQKFGAYGSELSC